MVQSVTPEWSHNIETEDIGEHPVKKKISASPQQRKDLAKRLEVENVNELSAELVISQQAGKSVIHVSGNFKANVTHISVISAEAFEKAYEGAVEGWFANPDRIVSLTKMRNIKKSKSGEVEVPMLEEKDDPEPIIDGMIDIAELVTQHVSLEIDPFPHKEGEHFPTGDDHFKVEASPERQNPFAALKVLKNKNEAAE